MNLHALAARLDQDYDRIGHAALACATDQLASAVRMALSTPPGGPHEHPWLRSGELRNSIEAWAEGDAAVVGSKSVIALYQEVGNVFGPPHPTLAPLAASGGELLAHRLAEEVVQALRGN